MRDLDGAKETFRAIITNYGDQSEQANKILTELEKRTAPKPATTTTTTKPAGTGK